MKVGVHLPLADFGDGPPTGADLRTYASTARELGYTTLAANDHLVWRLPWLDGPTALATRHLRSRRHDPRHHHHAACGASPCRRRQDADDPRSLADGPVVGGLGPGSSQRRLRRGRRPVRGAMGPVRRGAAAGPGAWYAASRRNPGRTTPAETHGSRRCPTASPQVWFGSWGSDRRLAAMAAEADGWFASAYNATPSQFAEARARLDDHLRAAGREPDDFPDAVATMWLFVTESRREAEQVLNDVLAPALNRDPALLADLPVGGSQHCSEVLAGYAAAGAREVLLWPIRDNLRQLERGMGAASSL